VACQVSKKDALIQAQKKLELGELKSILQRHLGDGLVTIVGSGLSCAEGMPGMGDLTTHLKATVSPQISTSDTAIWTKIVADLDTIGLEAALLKTQPTATLEAVIMSSSAELLLPAEEEIIAAAITGKRILRFTRLLKHLLKPTSGIPIITTNYDRLIEFASEQAGLGVDTMFVGSYCGYLNEKESHNSFLRDAIFKGSRKIHYRYRERIKLFKPHGSLDWYQGANGPLRHSGNTSMARLIITPGINKFRNGYESPFDTHRDRANAAIDGATRFLAIGYGFNDDHLETHLRPLLRAGKPALLLTRSISAKAKELVQANPHFISLEYGKNGSQEGTKVSLGKSELFFPNIQIWDLGNFIDEVLEP
jgi:hypothetical protein